MKLIVLDENLQELVKMDYLNNSENKVYDIYPNVHDIDEENKILCNNLDCGVGVFSPTEKFDDFYISFLNNKALAFYPSNNINNFKGVLISDSYFNSKTSLMLDKLKEVYETNQSQTVYFEYYNDKFLFRRLNLKIFKVNNLIYIIGRDETDYNVFSMKKNQFLENYPQAIAIIQDDKIVKCNKQYLKIEYPKTYTDILNKEIDYEFLNTKTKDVKQVKSAIKNILEQRIYTESFPLEIYENDKIKHCFNLNLIYILYNSKPAVIIFFEDVTKEKLYINKLQESLKKSLTLEHNLKKVQKISKTAVIVKDKGKFKYSDSIYNILKINPEEYKDKDNFLEFIVEEDIHKWEEAYKRCSPESPESKIRIRFINKENELIHINCYIVCTYDNNNTEVGCVTFYEDITEEVEKNQKLKEALEKTMELNNNLERIQSASKTFITYSNDLKNFSWTPEVYNILEINPEDYKNRTDDILKDFLIDEDKKLAKDSQSKISLNNPNITFNVRIKTGKGNIKYIKSIIYHYYDKNGKFVKSIGFSQDITSEMTHQIKLEKALKETKELNDSLERIQNASKTYITYSHDLITFTGTDEVYNILEINPEDYKDRTNDILNVVMEFIIDEDKKLVENALSNITIDNPNTTLTVRLITGKGNLKYLKCVVHFDYDENGNFIKGIGFNQDITEEVTYQKQLQKSLKETKELNENLERIQKIQNASKTFIIHSPDLKNFSWTPDIFDILEIDPENYKNKKYNIIEDFITEEDKEFRKKELSKISPTTPDVTFIQRIKTGKENIKYIKTVIHHDYDKKGNFIRYIGSNHDITEEITYQKQLQKALKETRELNDNLERIQNASKTFITYSNDLKNFSWTPEVYKILEINPKEYKDKTHDILKDFVIDEDKALVKNALTNVTVNNPNAIFNVKIKTGKGNIKYIKTVIHYDYDKKGNLIKTIGFNQDITKEITYQKQLETTVKDKNILLKEIHHRVKNNLQIILSLINLNIDFDTNTENTLLNTQNHLYAMALIHEKIYGSDSLSEVDMKDYIESLISAILDLYESNIKTHLDIDQINLDMEQSIPLGLIINELVTNTIKYAFPDKRQGNIHIELKKEDKEYKFIYMDDGIGLPKDFDIDKLTSLGLIVVTNLTIQLDGTFNILDCKGTGYKIEF